MTCRTLALAALLVLPASGVNENDAFSQAKEIESIPASLELSFEYQGDPFATREPGEPYHAGRPGYGSVWYKWTPKENKRVVIRTIPSNRKSEMKNIIAVYTGSKLEELVPAQRSKDLPTPAISRARQNAIGFGARTEFDAQKGATYFIAVDTETKFHERYSLKIEEGGAPFHADAELITAATRWDYLFLAGASGRPIDPELLDGDFSKTWTQKEGYDGPPFNKDGFMPIGYGDLHRHIVRTNFGGKPGYKPKADRSFTAYLRTTFTPESNITGLGIEGIFDDGAVIYVNGKEVQRFNLSPDKRADRWNTLADGPTIREEKRTHKVVQYAVLNDLDLPAGKPVQVAVSVHSSAANNYDTLFSMRMFSLAP
ncbi:MAG: hypothetical protein ACON38_00775 [Akkermansiaceae bacterium]